MTVQVDWENIDRMSEHMRAEWTRRQQTAQMTGDSLYTVEDIEEEIAQYMRDHKGTKLKRVSRMRYFVSLKTGSDEKTMSPNPLSIGADIWLATKRE